MSNIAHSSSLREKTLFDVLQDVWRARISMIFCAGVALVFALAFVVAAQKYSRAEMIVAPANPLGDLFSAPLPAGEGTISVQNPPIREDIAFLRFENSFFGAQVARILIKDESILKGLAADKAFPFSQSKSEWTAAELAAYVKKRVRIEPVSGTPLRKLTYLHSDPAFAVKFLSQVYAVTDELIRAGALRDVQARTAYLDDTIAKTADADHRRILTDILMGQERIRMLVSVDQPFSAAIIEPPSASARPVWPDPYLIIPAFVFAGLLLGFVMHGVRHYGR